MTVFLDANVVMYLIGAPHPNQDRTRVVLRDLVQSETRLVTDAEVYQEILHRYAALHRLDAIDLAFSTMSGLVDAVFPIGMSEIDAAKALVLEGAGARDALHAVTMRSNSVGRIFTFDRDFDRFDDLTRLS